MKELGHFPESWRGGTGSRDIARVFSSASVIIIVVVVAPTRAARTVARFLLPHGQQYELIVDLVVVFVIFFFVVIIVAVRWLFEENETVVLVLQIDHVLGMATEAVGLPQELWQRHNLAAIDASHTKGALMVLQSLWGQELSKLLIVVGGRRGGGRRRCFDQGLGVTLLVKAQQQVLKGRRRCRSHGVAATRIRQCQSKGFAVFADGRNVGNGKGRLVVAAARIGGTAFAVGFRGRRRGGRRRRSLVREGTTGKLGHGCFGCFDSHN